MKLGLNLKFICYTVFIVVFISLVFSAVFIYQSRKALLHEFKTRAQSLVENLALNLEVPLLIENKQAINSLAQNLLKEKDVQSVRIFNQSGKVIVSIDDGAKLLPWQKEKILFPVYFSSADEKDTTEHMNLFFEETNEGEDQQSLQPGQIIGKIEVMFSRKGIILTLMIMRWWIFVAATIAVFIGGAAGLYFSRTLILPMQRLAKATYSIARGNWEERLEVLSTDELGQLTESFNLMSESLIKKRDQLENTYRELATKEKMADIGKFSMIIAHELKNPLGIIKGSVDILSKDTTQPEIKQTMISYIQDEVKRLAKLIDDFLSFAKPTPPQKSPSDVNSVVKKAAGHFVLPEEFSKKISMHTDFGTLPEIEMDENQIYHALLNLLNNSGQAIDRKGDIFITTKLQDMWIKILVSDTGSGIREEQKEKIFEPFFTTKAKGTGLGLAIVKKIVDNHDGKISVSNASGGGTCFEIDLPVKK